MFFASLPGCVVYKMAVNNTSYNQSMGMCLNGSAIGISFGFAETIIWSVISVITVVGTLFSIGRLLKDIHRLPDHNVYVLSLLASDFCIGVVGHTTIAYAAYTTRVPCIMARVIESVIFFSIIVSLSSSLVVAINRSRALDIKHSRVLNRIQRDTRFVLRKSLFIVCSIWLCSVGLTLLIALAKLDVSFSRAVGGLLCFLVLTANCRLLCNICRYKSHIHASSNSHIISNRMQKLAVRAINAMIITLLLTCLPSMVVTLLIRNGVFVLDVVVVFTRKLILFGPAIDPITYFIIYCVLK